MTEDTEELVAQTQQDSHEEPKRVPDWLVTDVLTWAKNEPCSKSIIACLENEAIDGQVLLAITENDIRDFRCRFNYKLTFGEMKKLWLSVRGLQLRQALSTNAASSNPALAGSASLPTDMLPVRQCGDCGGTSCIRGCSLTGRFDNATEENYTPYKVGEYYNGSSHISVDGRATNIPPEFFKTFISLGYSFLVTWITSFVMVIVHERVPDMKRYPPLPDIFLDNVPHIPWAFQMCEVTGTLLFGIWTVVCVFHKYRMVLLRRFFALAGTVFLLRCVTMLITSLSVPGTHLQCNPSDYAVDDTDLTLTEALELRISRAYIIWSGLGMSIQGVRTCGDYMFSGHTVALTLLNFFITEYTPRNLYFLHTLSWLLNMFGIFFILAAHEHYSIDVFVAFYITSRLFLYYHTLANNQALMSRDSNRTRIWFPMFSYFENSVDGIIPNEYDTIGNLAHNLWSCLHIAKDMVMLTAQRFWIDPNYMKMSSKSDSNVYGFKHNANVSTSTSTGIAGTPTSQDFSTSCAYQGEDLLRHKRGTQSNADLSVCTNAISELETHSPITIDSAITKKNY